MEYKIVRFDYTMLDLLPQPQEAFEIIGRLVPRYDGKEWSISEILLDTPYMKTYPDDVFDPKIYVENPNEAAYIAMLDGQRVGSIRVGRRWNKNAFIDDLLVDQTHRGRGVGTMLMNAAVQWGKENGFHGISLETQDNNLLACRFYLKYGFKLGGIDRHSYDAFQNSDETALYFYLFWK
jgi:streptothricin acetyltransferase